MLAAPAWVVIQLLEECNLRCGMCYEWGDNGAYHGRAQPAMLDADLVLRIVEECLPARPVFEFFGGEPLLYPRIWEVISRIREAGCELAFSTNGTLLEKHAERLVENGPSRLWISLDGPPAINDQQRGRGVFNRVLQGLNRLQAVKRASGRPGPELGLTCVVTPANAAHVEALFLENIDLELFDYVSIELQSYITREQGDAYASRLRREFGVAHTPCAEAYVRDQAIFGAIDCAALARQIKHVATICGQRQIRFHSQPTLIDEENIRRYFAADWQALAERKSRCALPWLAAEISARGEVGTCHSFYDLAVGNIHEQALLDIWRGERLRQLRQHLRDELFPVCTACCRYYGDAVADPARVVRHG